MDAIDVAYDLIKEVLRDEKLSTTQIEFRLQKEFSYHCPDSIAKTLQKLKVKNLIENKTQNGEIIWYLL